MILKEYAAIDIETKDGKTYSVDESGIIRDSLTTSSSCSSGGGIPAGSCNAGTISVSFRAPSGLAYSKLAKAKVHLYVWYGNASKTKVGVYNVTSAENNYGIYTVSGSDNVGLLDDGCYSAVDTKNAQNWLFTVLSGKFEPVSVIFNQICSAYGVPHYNSSENQKIIPESGNTMLCTCVSEECSIESVKDFASYLAEYLGCFIVPAPDGRLRFCRFGDRKCSVELNETNIQRGSYQRSPYYAAPTIWKISFDSGYGSWWYRTTDIPDNAAPLSVNLTNNPFWQAQEDMIPDQYSSKLTQMIKYMWSYICDAAYADDGNPCFNPFRCTVFVQYYFRVGDMVTIVDPFTGEKFKSYVTDVTWTFRGGQQISFAGEDTRTLSVNTNRNAAKKANDYSKYLYRKSKNGSGENVNTKYALSKSGHTITLTGSDGTVYNVTDDDTIYTHPSHAAHAKGFYKFANDDEGHVADAENVTKEDITALGIPGEDTNTTYELSINADGSNNSTDSTIYLNGSDGSSCSLLFDFTHKTEYGNTVGSLTKLYDDNFKIAVGIRYAPTKWIWESGATAATTVGVGYTDRDGTAATLITDFANDILVHNVVGHDNNTVTGKRNSVLGQNHTVSGSDNAVSGIHNAVSGYRNCVTGAEMTVAGDNDIVGGYRNTVTADHATVGGFVNTVTEHGDSSTVFGYGLYCDATIQAVFGHYNAKDPSVYSESQKSYYGKYALIVGNGLGDTDRSNAFAVDWDGKLWCGTDTTSLNAQIKSKAESTELAKYLPLTGGTMSGDIDMYTSKSEVLIGASPSTSTKATPAGSSYLEIANSMSNAFPSLRSFIGTYHNTSNNRKYNVISVRHRNGYTGDGADGNKYGMYIYADLLAESSLSWNQQLDIGEWTGLKVLLDSANYTNWALAKDGTAKKAELLTETSWTALPNTYAASMTVNTLKYKKVGQIVFIRGGVKFTDAQSGPLIGVLPNGYRPDQKLYKTGWSGDKVAAYGITVGSDGYIALQSPSTSAGWFATAYTFYVDISFVTT